jgi:threonine aldolase
MRKAMAEAEVGDDVYGDDPTVERLEKLGAECLGKEASLFVPSGTFGNQLALFSWCGRGTEVILGDECHIIQHEAGAASVIAGVQTRPVSAPDGVLPGKEIEKRLRRRDLHAPETSLICLENAHSLGKAAPLAAMDETRRIADSWKLPVHLDGARIFNAAVALKTEAEDIARRADSVMFCLSKGLCAPVGSLLAGPKDFVAEARMKRKIMGGGMRQAGILAAAGIVALDEQAGRLAEDHERARHLENFLSGIPGVNVQKGDINMVFFSYAPAGEEKEAARIVNFFRDRGILIGSPENGLFRFVTHYWIGDRELEEVKNVSKGAFQ